MKTFNQTQHARKLPAFVIATLLFLIGVFPNAEAVSPPPDGGYAGFNTAEGEKALFSLTTGVGNAAIGWFSLFSNRDGSFNTALGAGTLLFNVGNQSTGEGTQNTALGAAALLFNTTGTQNTATGSEALTSNTEGDSNTANGFGALYSNTSGDQNTAIGSGALNGNTIGTQNTANGASALFSNGTGNANTATGVEALLSNTTGEGNTADGAYALDSNSTGNVNTAIGDQALYSNATGNNNTANGFGALEENAAGNSNTAVGVSALFSNFTGNSNTAIGDSAGSNITGDGNVCIGAGVTGVAGENNITRIRNIYESVATERAVYVTSDNRIGTLSSSRRYKEQIKPMENASEAIHSLRPVSFRYKKEIDPTRSLSFGLIAEEVARVSPDLVTPDRQGKPETVRYEAVNAMLLNEFLKEHRKVQEQAHTIAELKNEIANLTVTVKDQATQIQKVTSRLEVITFKMVGND
ncbi:MAG TPA: tail fiber domain-containing protein [Candidatus Udaeobacter sp.]|nr:tail fiber domain-containing protein [Candidatus Udaeobacter sp.]